MSVLRLPTLNRVLISGRLVNSPDLLESQYENRICRFTLDTEDPDHPVRTDVVVLGPAAEFCGGLRTGQAVMIEGRIGTREWTDPDGQIHRKTEVHTAWVQCLEA